MAWVAKCFRENDRLPDGRTPQSLAYKVESVWSGAVVDELYTDDPVEAERIAKAELAQAYDVHITHAGSTEIRLAD
jgi:hypothetical protein